VSQYIGPAAAGEMQPLSHGAIAGE